MSDKEHEAPVEPEEGPEKAIDRDEATDEASAPSDIVITQGTVAGDVVVVGWSPFPEGEPPEMGGLPPAEPPDVAPPSKKGSPEDSASSS